MRSLGTLVRTRARVRRDGDTLEVDAEELVPGDIVLLESGNRVPADLRLLEVHGLRVDELFEVMHIGNARSESVSIFRLSPLRNRVLLLGTLTAVAVHVAALHTPLFQRALGVGPVPLEQWAPLVGIAAVIVVVLELHKGFRSRRSPNREESVS